MQLHHLQSDTATECLPVVAGAEPKTLPRVLCVFNLNPGDKFGSLEEQIVFLHRAFAEEGSLFLPLFTFPQQPGGTAGFRERGVAAHCLDMQKFHWRSLLALRKLVRTQGIDVIHWHFTDPLCNPYVWWLSVLCPTVRHYYTDHISRLQQPYTPPAGWKRMLKRFLLKRYSQTWCVSQFVHDCLVEQGTWSNLHVCRHFINTDRFVPDPTIRSKMRRQFGVEDRFVMTVIAQLIPEKGIDIVIRAMTDLPDKAVLWIVGTGHQAEQLQALTRTLGVQHRVQFFGLQRQVQPFLQATDCFVLASRWKEAAGLVLLEAQASGLPVVASRIGGIPEYIDEERSGLLFTPEDDGALANHVRALCDDPDRCRRMGQRARSLVMDHFSPDSRLADWLDLYRQ